MSRVSKPLRHEHITFRGKVYHHTDVRVKYLQAELRPFIKKYPFIRLHATKDDLVDMLYDVIQRENTIVVERVPVPRSTDFHTVYKSLGGNLLRFLSPNRTQEFENVFLRFLQELPFHEQYYFYMDVYKSQRTKVECDALRKLCIIACIHMCMHTHDQYEKSIAEIIHAYM